MDGRKTHKVTNCKQFELLVKLMEKNVCVARGYMGFGSSKKEFTNIWNEIADQLNSVGPPIRNGVEWQNVWNDFRRKVKQKLGHNKKEMKATGGGCNKLYNFSILEESVIDLLMLREVCQPNSKTFGLNTNVGQSSSSRLNTAPIIPTITPLDLPIPLTTAADSSNIPETTLVEQDSIIRIPFHDYVPVDIEYIDNRDNTITNPTTKRQALSSSNGNTHKINQKKSCTDDRLRLLQIQTNEIKETKMLTKEVAR